MIFRKNEKVLEVGGGDKPMYRPNLDVRALPTVDIVADLSKPWPVPASSYAGVYSAYVMEHVSWREVAGFVREIFRVLEPGGRACVITSNTEAQMRWALAQGSEYDKVAQCLFGDLDYPENSHKSAFNPTYAMRLFREAGFRDVLVYPYGLIGTDLAIEVRKPKEPQIVVEPKGETVMDAGTWTPVERKEAYNRHYFDGGRGKVGGYSREGYWDYPVHHLTAEKVLALKPESVLELGCARGYILKRLEDAGVYCRGLEVSDHCRLTRVTDAVRTFDITETPWPFKDREFDLCFSIAVLEHIPEAAIERVCAEIRRVSRRGLHGVDFGEHDDGFDKTHCLLREKPWWQLTLNPRGFESDAQEVVDKEDLERGPVSPPGPSDDLVKLNCGSWKTMFHHGWINIDVGDLLAWASAHGYRFIRQDLRTGIPFPNASVSLIYASHFLEHLNYEDGLAFLRDAWRTLKPGGVLRIAVPDATRLARRYLDGDLGEFDEISDSAASRKAKARKLWDLLMSGHQAIYDAEALREQLADAGFHKVDLMPFAMSGSKTMRAETFDMFPDLSLYMEAIR